MRLLIIPLLLTGLLIQAPTPALGNANQQAAERIADIIGEHFPDADVSVSYRGGQVGLKGEVASQSQREKIVERIFSIPGVNVTEISDEMQIVTSRAPASRAPASTTAQPARPVASAANAPVPVPNAPNPRAGANNARQTPQPQAQQQARQQQAPQAPPPQTMAGALLATHPHPQYPAAYGMKPGQQSAVPHPFTPTSFSQHPQAIQMPVPHQAQQHHPAYHGPQGPLPGHYNQPHLPDYAWPAYANYPNYAQVSYPRSYSPQAWPYIGPFYPYPQVPLGWRKVTLEHSNGWWWLDFDDGTPSGPFSGLFRQPLRYTY